MNLVRLILFWVFLALCVRLIGWPSRGALLGALGTGAALLIADNGYVFRRRFR